MQVGQVFAMNNRQTRLGNVMEDRIGGEVFFPRSASTASHRLPHGFAGGKNIRDTISAALRDSYRKKIPVDAGRRYPLVRKDNRYAPSAHRFIEAERAGSNATGTEDELGLEHDVGIETTLFFDLCRVGDCRLLLTLKHLVVARVLEIGTGERQLHQTVSHCQAAYRSHERVEVDRIYSKIRLDLVFDVEVGRSPV